MVIMSMEVFEANYSKLSMNHDIEVSEEQIRKGQTKDARKALRSTKEKYGL